MHVIWAGLTKLTPIQRLWMGKKLKQQNKLSAFANKIYLYSIITDYHTNSRSNALDANCNKYKIENNTLLWQHCGSNFPARILHGLESFLNYHYPDLKGQWQTDEVNNESRFQNGSVIRDYGYHILNFAEAAANDRIIHTDDRYAEFKNEVLFEA